MVLFACMHGHYICCTYFFNYRNYNGIIGKILFLHRGDLEPSEFKIPNQKCPWAHSQKPGRERHSHHRKTKLCSIRHDHSPLNGHYGQTAAGEEGTRCSPDQMGQRDQQDGQKDAGPHCPRSCIGCSWKCFRVFTRWWLWPGYEEGSTVAWCWSWRRGAEEWSLWDCVGGGLGVFEMNHVTF